MSFQKQWIIFIGAFLLLSGCAYLDNDYFKDIDRSELPVLIIDVKGQNIKHDEEKKGLLTVAPANNSFQFKDELSFYRMGIEQKGWTSMGIPKHQFGFELINESGNEIVAPILDLPAGNAFRLHGPYYDKSLIRNHLTYRIWKQLGHYSVKSRFVELYIHKPDKSNLYEKNVYLGVYLLVEKIETGPFRLDIKTNPDPQNFRDLGFIVELIPENRIQHKGFDFETKISGSYYAVKFPDLEKKDQQKIKLIADFMDHMEAALYQEEVEGQPPAYLEYIDINSFVDLALINELSNNPDAYYASVYFHKSAGEKLKAGPVWDFNVAYGGNSWTASPSYNLLDRLERPMISQFLQSNYFRKKIKQRWEKLISTGMISSGLLNNMIDQDYQLLKNAQLRNFEKYDILGVNLKELPIEIPQTYEEEIAFLKTFLEKKINTMNVNYNNY